MAEATESKIDAAAAARGMALQGGVFALDPRQLGFGGSEHAGSLVAFGLEPFFSGPLLLQHSA